MGSGASFPFPIYSTWFKDFSRSQTGVLIDYQPKGSGAGVRDFINYTVDFAGSDAAMSDAEIALVDRGVQMLPVTAGSIVLSYNLPGNPRVRLPREAYAAIFMGELTRWDDPRLVAANPEITLPDLPLTVVRRADSSGTTFVFTRHLAAISERWANAYGSGKRVLWPRVSHMIASPKNDGVMATIKQTPGAIGYVEYGYARHADMPMAALENASGSFVTPDLASGMAALDGATLPENMRVWISDPRGRAAYPIVTFTWLLLYRHYDEPRVAAHLRDLVRYCLQEGQEVADRLGYIPLPDTVTAEVLAALDNIR